MPLSLNHDVKVAQVGISKKEVTMQSNSLTADITKEEIQDAIGRLKANKSSGIDGCPTEWY